MTARKASRRTHQRHGWSDLMLLLRRYKPADAAPTWEHDLKVEVDKIIAVFADKKTPLVAWLPAVTVIAVEVLTKATPSQLESFLEHLPYLPIGRSGDLPLPARTRERLAIVRDDAVQLASSLQAAIVDPVMQVAGLAGFFLPVALQNDQRIFTPEGRQAVVQEALDAMTTSDETGLTGIRQRLLGKLPTIEAVRKTASLGIEMIEGRQLKGWPPRTPGRAPSLLILVATQQYAPPPSSGVEEWRLAVEEFVILLLESSGLPPVDREFVRANLPV